MSKLLSVRNLIIFALCAVVVAIFTIRSAKFYSIKHAKSPSFNGITYEAMQVSLSPEKFELMVNGKIESGSNVTIISESIGKIKQKMVEKYAFVPKDGAIFEIEDILESVSYAEDSAIPEIETTLDEKYAVKSSKSVKNMPKKSVTARYIISPCDGYLKDIFLDSGSNVARGTAVAFVACAANLSASGSISLGNAKFISLGSEVVIIHDESSVKAKISGIAKVINSNGMVRFTAKLPKSVMKNFFIDQDVDMKIIGKKFNVAKIPQSAIILDRDGKISVFVVENNVAKKKNITLISEKDGTAMVLGLAQNDIIITSSVNSVRINEEIKYVVSQK